MTTPPQPDLSGSSDDSGSTLSPEWQQTLSAFAEFQRKHRGTRDATIRNHLQVLRRFGEHVSEARASVQPNELTPRHIDQFLIVHMRPLGRSQTRKAACSIRALLRYLAFLGQVPAERSAQVHTPKIYRLAGLPRGLGQDDLHRVLCDVERRDARGRRQYAMLMLLATYGLRASDVAGPTNHRQVFLSLRTPFHPLLSLRVSKIVREALDHAGVTVPRGVAAHAFRHGFATRLVRNGVALDVVAKCLDHATSATTEIYTKLAIEDLRSVSLDPRAVLS
jgi:site-specific recombinase XerD